MSDLHSDVPRVLPPMPYSEPGRASLATYQQEPRAERAALRRVLEVLRPHVVLIAVLTLLTAGITAYLVTTEVPRYRARAVVQLVDARDLLPKEFGSRASEQPAEQRVDPVLSQLMVLQGRGVLGEVVDREGLRLTTGRSDGLSRSRLADVQVALPPAVGGVLHLAFGAEQVAARIEQPGSPEGRAEYGAPLVLPGLRFTVPARPAVPQATLALVPREDAVDSVAKTLRAVPREGTNGVEVEFTSPDSAAAVRVVNAVVDVFQNVDARTARQQAQLRRVFLEKQLLATDSLVNRAQSRLTEFQRRGQVYSSRDELIAQQTGMLQLETRREELEADRRTYQMLLNSLNESRRADGGELQALVSSAAGIANPIVAQLYTQLVQYETARDSLTAGEWARAGTNPDVQRLTLLVTSTRARLVEAMRSQIGAIGARINALDELHGRRATQIQALPSALAEQSRLDAQVTTLTNTGDELRSEYQKARIAEAVETGQVHVISLASRAQPVGTHRSVRLLFGVVLGLLIGVGGAFLVDHLNTSIRHREEIETLLQIPGLAVIPRVAPPVEPGRRIAGLGNLRFWRSSGSARRLDPHSAPHGAVGDDDDTAAEGIADDDTTSSGTAPTEHVVSGSVQEQPTSSAAAEAYRTLRTNLIFAQTVVPLKTLVITSPSASDGKTTTAVNLSIAFAQQGLRVLLMECDLRRPRLAATFGISSQPGLTDVLLAHVLPGGAIQSIGSAGLDVHLDVLLCGTPHRGPSELLGSPQMRALVMQLADRYDLVVMDTPPVLAASDATVLAANADGVLLVLRAGETDRDAAQYAVQQLTSVRARLIGAVLNDPDAKLARYGGYYDYAYAAAEKVTHSA